MLALGASTYATHLGAKSPLSPMEGFGIAERGATQSGPSLFPLILPSEKIPRNGPVTVGCLAKDVPPALVRFTWEDHNNGSINSSSIKQYPTVGNSAGTFTASSQMTVSAEDWENFQPFYCKAENVNGSARIVRRAAQTEPKLIIRGPRQQDFKNPNKNANIVCVGSHMHDASTTVQWLKDGNILDSGFTTTGSAAAGCGGYSVVSELAVSKADWSADKKFSCRVHNKMFSRTENISSSMICDSDCPGDIVEVHVETIPPSFVDIYLTKSANLTCRISNLPEEEDLKELHVTWTRVSDKKELDTVIGQVKRQENSEMFFVDATATICKEEWDKDAFECKVTHHLLPAAEIKTLRKLHGGTPHAPAVYVLPPPSEQLALQETATITCLVKGFYPNDFFVKWMRNDEPVGPSEYFTSQPIQESKTPERYFAYSTLNVKEQDWSYGATYTCVVGHEAFPLQMSQKTLDKNTGKPTLVNVSLVLSDIASSCH
uniref:Uncharacterized protein n=1 Tax=Sphaerodactylus townsendi TaxID=933632 RepID=A0ACB8EX15_9SAUR